MMLFYMQVPHYFYFNLLAIIVWFFYKRKNDRLIVFMGCYILYCFLFEIAAWGYSYITYKSNHWIYNLYTIGQILLLCFIYRNVLTSNSTIKSIKIFTVFYPLLVLINLLFFQSFFNFHTLTYTIGCLFLIFLIFSYFNQLLHLNEVISLRRNSFFWFNLGNAIYFIGSIFYLGSINFILATKQDSFGELINIFVYSFTSIQYILFIIAFKCNLKPEAS